MKNVLLKVGYPIGLLILTAGVLLTLYKGHIINYFVEQNINLKPGGFIFDSWAKVSPVPVYLEFYLFDLVNRKEFEVNGAKPVLEEIGPFVYREIRTKENIGFNGNGTITYEERRRFHFVPEKSAYPENRTITTLSMGAMTVINLAYRSAWSRVASEAINWAFYWAGESLLVTQPASRMLFGYEDPFLKKLRELSFFRDLVPSDVIGLYYGKNDTTDGVYTVYDGVDNSQQIGAINYWNGKSHLTIWSDEYANQINGTDGSLEAPFMNETTRPTTFQSDACRSVYLVFNETRRTFYDIKLNGYIMDETLFANVSVNPSNAGFCTPPGNCLVSGLLNLSACATLGGISLPAYMSMPHFLFGDESLLENIIGLEPNASKHRTAIFYEPLTGLPMKANKRVQVNTKIIKSPYIDLTKNLISDIYFPLFWIDENFEIDEKNAHLFYKQVSMPLVVYDFVKHFLLAIGGLGFMFCLFATGLIIYRNQKRQSEGEPHGIEESSEANETTPLIIE